MLAQIVFEGVQVDHLSRAFLLKPVFNHGLTGTNCKGDEFFQVLTWEQVRTW